MTFSGTPEQELMRLLTFSAPTSEEEAAIKSNLSLVQDWDAWFEIAHFNKIIPHSYHRLEAMGLLAAIPTQIRRRMSEEANAIAHTNELRNTESNRFLQKFREQDIPVALLKGVAMGETVYRNPAYKRMNDIDLLIHKSDLDRIYQIYDELDYFFIGERISGDRDKSDKMTHVAPAFVSPNFHCVIGTQWGIKTPLGPYTIDYDGIWERMVPVEFQGLELATLSPEDHLHHFCLHLGFYKISLRDMMDFYNLLRAHREDFDWNRFYRIVEESKSQTPVWFGLKLTHYLDPMPEVATMIQRIEKQVKPGYLKGFRKKTRSADVFLNLHSDHMQSIEKVMAVMDSSDWFPEKQRYFRQLWRNILFPPRAETIRMSALYQPSAGQFLWARTTMGYRVLKVIAGEIGWKLTVLLSIKTVVDTAVSFFRWPFVSRKKTDTHAYAQRLGVPLEKLLQLKEQFQ